MDGVSSDYELIYNNQLHYSLNFGKLVGITTVPSSIGLQLYYYWTETMPITEYVTNTRIVFNYSEDMPIMIAGFVLMNILVTSVCHAFTLRIFKKNDE